MATSSLENVGWLGEGGENHSHIFDASVSLDPLTSTVYEAFSQGGTGSNGEGDGRSMGECHVGNATDGNLQAWPQGYTLYPAIQQEMVGADMQEMMPPPQLNNLPIPNDYDSKAPHPHLNPQ